MSGPESGVLTAMLDFNGTTAKVYYVAFAYPTDLAAAQAWESCEPLVRKKGQHISVYRVQDSDATALVVALSETEIPIRSAQRLLRNGGAPHEMPLNQLRDLYLRRARVTVAQEPCSGEAFQRARYGRAGAWLTGDGRLRPRRRPQG